jgi:hypothetical protein
MSSSQSRPEKKLPLDPRLELLTAVYLLTCTTCMVDQDCHLRLLPPEGCALNPRCLKPFYPTVNPSQRHVDRIPSALAKAPAGRKSSHSSSTPHLSLCCDSTELLRWWTCADAAFKNAGDAGADEAVVAAALKRSFIQLDNELLAAFEPDKSGDGCTALVVLRVGAALYTAHAGDSRAVLARHGAFSRSPRRRSDGAQKAFRAALQAALPCWVVWVR